MCLRRVFDDQGPEEAQLREAGGADMDQLRENIERELEDRRRELIEVIVFVLAKNDDDD